MNIIAEFASPNYSVRNNQINFIIIHYTEMNDEAAIAKMCDPAAGVSCHYLIKASGEIIRLVKDEYAAWHAGSSYWQGLEQLNDHSIGIELDNLGCRPYTLIQMNNCLELCQQLIQLHNIPPANILGHSDISPDRKIDPSPFFDWSYLAKHNLGLWHDVDVSEVDAKPLFNFGDSSPAILMLQNDLKKLGYRVATNGIFDQQTNYVIRAFQAHFYPQLIQKLGMDFYWDNNAKYCWDTMSGQILRSLQANHG